ncbi:hypothetical protein [Marinoscillum sp. MHG1-6]|uniref:hypothetical protein n=1 Tax=Marinoscillum sp. MHG1-6 TaxID=2959627 RepID=UPI0021578F8F|nr:hypothetical protein [Marinoscillum sp. MHG1-6]
MVGEVAAQLITDSDRRLKTQKAKPEPPGRSDTGPSKSPFQAFRKKKSVERRTSSIRPFNLREMKQSSPRSISGNRSGYFESIRVAPRYSAGSPFREKRYKSASPRVSSGSPFQDFRFNVAPRYSSSKNIWSKQDLIRTTPRYSAGSPFRDQRYKTTSPRMSSGSPFRGQRFNTAPRYSSSKNIWSKQDLMKLTPRYSMGNPFKGYNFNRSPRYSQSRKPGDFDWKSSGPRYSSTGDIWSKKDKTASPRLSAGSPFVNNNYKPSPRYSQQMDWNKRKPVSPRYSVAEPYKGYKYTSPRYSAQFTWPNKLMKRDEPRYSTGESFASKKYQPNPRYSTGEIQWPKKLMATNPRYSTGEMNWPNKLMKTSPRYSVGDPYAGYKYLNLPPRYGKYQGRFKEDKRAERANRLVEYETPFFSGETKIKWNKTKDMHPSFNYHYANQSSETIREGMRKWNVYWVRVNGNQEDPPTVKEKIKKPKFDRKEAKIWND